MLGQLSHCFLVGSFHVGGHTHGVLQRETLHAGQRLQAELLSAVHPQLQGDIRRYEHRHTCTVESRTGDVSLLHHSQYNVSLQTDIRWALRESNQKQCKYETVRLRIPLI